MKKKKDRLNEVLEMALNALDPLMHAYASARGQMAGAISSEAMVEVGRVSVKKLREVKLAVDGLYEFYKCRG